MGDAKSSSAAWRSLIVYAAWTLLVHFTLSYVGLWLWQLRDQVTPILFGQTFAIAMVLRSSRRVRLAVVVGTSLSAALATAIAYSTSPFLLVGSVSAHLTSIGVSLLVVRISRRPGAQADGEKAAPRGLGTSLAGTLFLIALVSPVAAASVSSLFAYLAGSKEVTEIFWLRWGSNLVGAISVLPFALTVSVKRLRETFTGRDAYAFYLTWLASLATTVLATLFAPFPFVIMALPLLYAASRFLVLGSSLMGINSVLALLFLSLQTWVPMPVLHDHANFMPVAIVFTLVSPLVVALLADQRMQALRRLADANEKVAEAAERRRIILDSIGDAVISTDAELRVEYLNPVAERLTGFKQAEAVGAPIEQVLQLFEDASETDPHNPMGARAKNPLIRCVNERRTIVLDDPLVLRHRNGSLAFVGDSSAPVLSSDGSHVVGAVAVFQDVTQKQEAARTMNRRAQRDALTGLFNRQEFELRLSHLLYNGDPSKYHAACFLDLDRFKAVNDTYGHAAGDAVLRRVADVLRAKTRGTDLVGRLGGDEFAICLVGCHLENARRVGRDIVDGVGELLVPWENGATLSVGVSVGLVDFSTGQYTLEELLKRADAACYAAKRAGRGRMSLHDADDLP